MEPPPPPPPPPPHLHPMQSPPPPPPPCYNQNYNNYSYNLYPPPPSSQIIPMQSHDPHNVYPTFSQPQINQFPIPMQSSPFLPHNNHKFYPMNNSNNDSNYPWNPNPSYTPLYPYPSYSTSQNHFSQHNNVPQFTHMKNMHKNRDRTLKRKRMNIMESGSRTVTLEHVNVPKSKGVVSLDRPSDQSCARGELSNSLSAAEAINIPDYLIVNEILVRLPVKSILRFRCVCKHWNSLTREKLFEDLHLERSQSRCNSDYTSSSSIIFMSNIGNCLHYFGDDYHKTFDFSNFPTNRFVRRKHDISNSCRGLICIFSLKSIQLVNPSTNERTELPRPSPRTNTRWIALAYDASIHRYKVARIFMRHGSLKFGCEILTLGAFQTWRYIGDPPSYGLTILGGSCHPFIADEAGRIYWGTRGDPQHVIISLDILSEKFDAIMLPKDYGFSFPKFSVLGGCCFLYNPALDQVCGNTYLCLWMLQQKDCTSQPWVKYRIKLDDPRQHDLLVHPQSVRYGKILFSDYEGKFYCWCDLKSGTLLEKPIFLNHRAAPGTYFETLLSPTAIQRGEN